MSDLGFRSVSKKRVLLAVPCHGDIKRRTFFRALGLMRYEVERGEVDLYSVGVADTILPRGRTDLAQIALDRNCDYVLFLDSDIAFPETALERLLAHGERYVGVNYPKRSPPYGWTASVPTTRDSKGLERVATLGFGLCLIHTDVFRKIPRPWFAFTWLADDRIEGEDKHFTNRYRQFFLDLPFVDHDLSKEITHQGELFMGLSEVELDEKLRALPSEP